MKRIVLYLAVFVALLGETHAQGGDRAYCNQLVDLYRKYVQNSPGRQFDVEATVALDDCRNGTNMARAIPILEKKLRASNISPPGGGEFRP